jgi:hypothetical protein
MDFLKLGFDSFAYYLVASSSPQRQSCLSGLDRGVWIEKPIKNWRNRFGPVSPVVNRLVNLKNFEIKILKKTRANFKIFGQTRI